MLKYLTLKELTMIKNRLFSGFILIFCLCLVTGAGAVSLSEATTIGKDNLKRLVNQSHHYQFEYDTVITLPVHSRTIKKDDFYLLYFIKDNVFQAEMEVDKKTGTPTLLAMNKMAPPYHELVDGTFNYKYFSLDSIMIHGFRRTRIEPDSARLVYFGVIPKLGKRGVVWELFSKNVVTYISLGGPTMSYDQVVHDMNNTQREPGNYAADSIRYIDLKNEIDRLQSLTTDEMNNLQLTTDDIIVQVNLLKGQIREITHRFPDLERRLDKRKEGLVNEH